MPVDITDDFIWITVKDSGLFVSDSFRQIDIAADQGIHARIGKLKSDPEGSTQIQAYYFEKSKFTTQEAEKWVKDHKKSSSSSPPERRCINSEVRLNYDSGSAKIIGYAAVFGQETRLFGDFWERVEPGAFSKTIINDDVAALINHEPVLILGRKSAGTLTLREDSHGLAYEIMAPDTSYAKDLTISIKRGDIKQSSFGFNIVNRRLMHEKNRTIQILKEVQLNDVSPVTFPAYPQTEVHVRMIAGEKEQIYLFEDSGEVVVVPNEAPQPVLTDEQFTAEMDEIRKLAAPRPRR